MHDLSNGKAIIHALRPTDTPISTSWHEDFRNPPAMFRPIPFWSWNERMEPDEVIRQIDTIADAGWGGVFVHARVGLTIDYLGKDWFRAVDAAIHQCRVRGLKVWLYDEDKWPSGFSGGTVPLANDRFRMRALVARRTPCDDARRIPAGCSKLLTTHSGITIYEWIAELGNPWFNGTSYTDLMNPDAVRQFIRDGYASYHDRYNSDYGDLIVAEFTDEPCTIFRLGLPEGAIPYSTCVSSRFQEMHGFDPMPHLHHLFEDSPDAAEFRLRYYRTINDLFETNFSKQIGKWCDDHGIAMTGHYMSEHSLYDQQLWGVKAMPNYRHQQIPGIDFLVRQTDEILPAKQCQSVVNQFDKRRMISELYGVAGQNLSFEDRWWMGCQQIALGVNALNPHLALFTMAGCRKRDYPPNLFYQQPWWTMNAQIDLPLSRLCVAMSQGRYVAEALIIHPQESTFAGWQGAVDVEDPTTTTKHDFEPTAPGTKQQIQALDLEFKAVLEQLLSAQRTFDLGDETLLAENGSIEIDATTPCVRVGVSTYRVVILPPMWTLARTTFDLLKAFRNAGGTIIRAGAANTALDGRPSAELDRFLDSLPAVPIDQLATALAQEQPPLVELASGQTDANRVLVHTRDLEDGSRLVFLTNRSRHSVVRGLCRFRGSFRSASRLDPFTGNTSPVDAHLCNDGLEVEITLHPANAFLIRLSPKETTQPNRDAEPLSPAPCPFKATSWEAERLDPNALPLDLACWRERSSGSWTTHPVPVLAIQERLNTLKYDGHLELRYRFRVDGLKAGRQVRLVIESPDRFDIMVNGVNVQYAGLPHWQDIRWLPIDITHLVQPGENVVQVTCHDFRHGDRTRFDDPSARYGTEIETIYLIGDFSVHARMDASATSNARWLEHRLPDANAIWVDGATLAITEPAPLAPGDVTQQGLPFYSGRLRVKAIAEPASDVRQLAVTQMAAAVSSVLADQKTIATWCVQPFLADIPRDTREIEVILYGTLRNLLGPHHHPEGELAAVTPNSFLPNMGSDLAQQVLHWATGAPAPDGWDARYCVVPFGELTFATFSR